MTQPGTDHAVNENEVGKITDLSFLLDFCDDKATLKKYINLYLELTPANLEKINIALRNSDYTSLLKIVHAMKAHLNYMGMHQTKKLAEHIELLAFEQKNLTGLPELIDHLADDFEKSKVELGVVIAQ